MSLSSWLWGSSQVDEAIDKATSELLPAGTEDIALNLEICDQIRSKAVPAKDAIRALKRRLGNKNPNVQLLTLSLTDVCIKNGGDHFLVEVASRDFMDNLVSILKMPGLNHETKNKILRMVQNWAIAFEGKPTLSYVPQIYSSLQMQGFNFPPKDLASTSAAMIDTQTAPEWIDSDVCLRCRTAFTFTNRKHHCRNCGQVFDQACSAKSMPLPHFGITQDVRVCDGCHSKLTKVKKEDAKPHHHHRSHSTSSVRPRSARELEDAELQRAIQQSLKEANPNRKTGYVPAQPTSWGTPSEPPIVDRNTHPSKRATVEDEDDDADMRAAIAASLAEANAPRPSAPTVLETPRSEVSGFSYGQTNGMYPTPQSNPTNAPALPLPAPPAMPLPNYELQPTEADAIMTFSQTVEQVGRQGGRDLSRYPAVNELYDRANGLRPKLAMALGDTDRKEKMLTEMNDKLSQVVRLYDKALTDHITLASRRATLPPQHIQAGPSPYQEQSMQGYMHNNRYATMGPVQQPQWGQNPGPMQMGMSSPPPTQHALPPQHLGMTMPPHMMYGQNPQAPQQTGYQQQWAPPPQSMPPQAQQQPAPPIIMHQQQPMQQPQAMSYQPQPTNLNSPLLNSPAPVSMLPPPPVMSPPPPTAAPGSFAPTHMYANTPAPTNVSYAPVGSAPPAQTASAPPTSQQASAPPQSPVISTLQVPSAPSQSVTPPDQQRSQTMMSPTQHGYVPPPSGYATATSADPVQQQQTSPPIQQPQSLNFPNFPSVPTQNFALDWGLNSNALEPEKRKEALLIDL